MIIFFGHLMMIFCLKPLPHSCIFVFVFVFVFVLLPHDDFGSLGLPAAALARDDDAGVFAGALHLLVRSLGDGEDVGSALVDFPAL